MNCHGSVESHCCWIDGVVCRFATIFGDRVLCGLRIVLGSWEAVHADPGYVEHVKPTYDRLWPGYGCGDFPQGIPAVMNDPLAGKCCFG